MKLGTELIDFLKLITGSFGDNKNRIFWNGLVTLFFKYMNYVITSQPHIFF